MTYKEKEYQLLSKKDGLALAVLFKGPAENHVDRCRGIVQIVHGMSEYKERYRPFMTYLAEHGFASIIHDHRGHGNSVRSEADYGFMYEVGTDGFLEDVLQVNELAVQLLPDKPVIMVGHSMGSLAARSLMREHDGCVDAMILSGAPCKNPAVNVAMGLAAFQKKLFGPQTDKLDKYLGDFVAIGIGKSIIQYTNRGEEHLFNFKGHHAGLTKEELEVPLIMIAKK